MSPLADRYPRSSDILDEPIVSDDNLQATIFAPAACLSIVLAIAVGVILYWR